MDKLKLNDDKTELMVIGSRQQLEKVSVAELSVGDTGVALQTCLVQRFFRPFYSGILIGQYARNNTLPSPPLPSFSRILYVIFYVTS